MNTLLLAFAIFLSTFQSSPEAQIQTTELLEFKLTDLNKVSVTPIISISEGRGLEMKDLFINLNGYRHNLELEYAHFDQVVNEFNPGELTWKKSIMLETSFILPYTAHRQHITIEGVTRITNLVDRSNFQVESQLTQIKGVNKTILWIHLLLELHVILLIAAVITLLILRAKPTKFWAAFLILTPVLGPISLFTYTISAHKRLGLAKS